MVARNLDSKRRDPLPKPETKVLKLHAGFGGFQNKRSTTVLVSQNPNLNRRLANSEPQDPKP